MPVTVTDADGKEIETFTQAELDAKVEETKAENQQVIQEAQTKVTALTEELNKMKENGANAGALRAKTEEVEAANAALKDQVATATKSAEEAKEQVNQL